MADAEPRSIALPLGLTVLLAVISLFAGIEFMAMREPEPIVPGPGVTAQRTLSDFSAGLRNTYGDTPVYELTGAEPGGTMVIIGGTHPQEISGLMTAILMIENATVSRGKIIVVPQANRSGFSHTEPMEAFAHTFTIPTPAGERWFRVGMRLANPIDQWPDPHVFVARPSGEGMVGQETRNLNRNYPGSETGWLTAMVGHGLIEMTRLEGAALLMDLHEAPPENPLSNRMVAHENAFETAAYAVAFMEANGVKINLEPSPRFQHGLSHREFGDWLGIQAILAETVTPAMGQFRGRLSQDLVVGGRDPNYVAANPTGKLFMNFTEAGSPLQLRVARHISALTEVINAFNELNPATPIVVGNIPTYQEVVANGVGAYLNPPPPSP
jgi:hypothetical protein